MFVFGHVGFGRTMIGSLRRTLPIAPFVVGALLPDAIDKPLYYSHVSSFVSCTRTFAHTGLFVLVLGAVAAATRSRAWTAVLLGVVTHVVLDTGMDMFSHEPSSEIIALTWPFLHTHFYSRDYSSPLDQLGQLWNPRIIVTELIGIALIVREYWRRTRS